MIDLDVWECRERHISGRHSVWREAIFFSRFECQCAVVPSHKAYTRSNLRLCLASRTRILSRACKIWWVMLKDELHSVPFLTTLDGKIAWKGDLYFFFFADGNLSKCSESTIYTQRRHGDKRAIRVPYLRDYCVYFMHSMTPCILWLSDCYQ